MRIQTKFNGYESGRRLYFKGGGGGGQVKYDNLERLYDEQAASARLLRGIAEQNLPGATQAYVGNVQNVLAPGYAARQANMAGADMAGANAMERAATERNLASMGVNPNDPRFAGSLRSTQVNNAARMAAGRNLSRNETQQYQLNVAKDAVGTFTGQSNNAATQMGNAASGLGYVYTSQANQKMAQDQAQANAVGNIANAGLTAYAMFAKDGGKVPSLAMLADGGNVAQSYDEYAATQVAPNITSGGYKGITPAEWESAASQYKASQPAEKKAPSGIFGKTFSILRDRAKSGSLPTSQPSSGITIEGAKDGGKIKKVERHMLGGSAGSQQNQGFFQMQSIAPPPTAQAPQQQGGGIVSPATMATMSKIAGKNGAVGTAMDRAGNAIADRVADAYTSVVGPQSQVAQAPVTDAVIKPVSEVATAAPAATEAVSAGAMAGLQEAGLATTAGTVAEGAGAGAAIAAEGGAAAGLMGSVGAALPWVGAAYAVGSLLDWWNEGGKVGTQNAGMSEQEAMQRFEQAEVTGTLADLRAGGRTPGEWVENRDTVPAMLVSGEQVLNSEASKLIGDKDAAKLNKKGLELRKQGKTPKQIKTVGLAGLESMV